MKRSTKFICVLGMGIVIGALGEYGLTYFGVNFRLLPYSKNGHTIVEPDRGHADRVEHIFSQFAHHIRLPATSKEVHRALNATWLKKEMIYGIYVLGGWIPVSITGHNTTAYHIVLHPGAEELNGHIYVSLSGGKGSEQEALEFLTGTGPDDMRLKEFALCYPPHPGQFGRIEMFTWWGIQVMVQ